MSKHVEQYEEKMKKTLASFETELATIRAGRANPHVLDRIMVDYYGTETPLNQVGNVTVPEARILMITPWDASMLKKIEKAIQVSELGINPTNDGKCIRLTFPELTEERRKALTKDIKKKSEDFKVGVRNVRRDAIDAFKKMEKKSEVTEDELKSLEDEIQKLTDKFTAEIDKIGDAKCKDIMSI